MKKLLLVEVPDGYDFTHKTVEIHNPTIPHLGATQYPEFKVIHLPTEEDIEEMYPNDNSLSLNQRIVSAHKRGAVISLINKILNQ